LKLLLHLHLLLLQPLLLLMLLLHLLHLLLQLTLRSNLLLAEKAALERLFYYLKLLSIRC
jgi:hypothetical protein